jgi:hypothetical protein
VSGVSYVLFLAVVRCSTYLVANAGIKVGHSQLGFEHLNVAESFDTF